MSQPLVSILIPAYNAEAWITATINCALEQSWPRKEIIIVDDGSRDRTLEVARQHEGANVCVIGQENQGASVARNRALAAAQGDYIQYLDADDLISENKIETQLLRLAEEPAGRIASCAWGRFEDELEAAQFMEDPIWADLGPIDWFCTAWSSQSMMAVHAWLTPRSIADRAGVWNTARCPIDDAEYFTRVVLASSGVAFCPEAKAYYRSGISTSFSRQTSYPMLAAILEAMERCGRNLLQVENSQRTRAASAALLQQYVYATYPQAPDLVARAEARIRELGGSELPFKSAGRLHVLKQLIGWKAAKRIQLMERNLRASAGKRS